MSSKALIVNDSMILACQLQGMLALLGVQTSLVSASSDPLPLAAQMDLVVLELQLDHANGFQLLRHLAANLSCPLILVSGTGRASDRRWGLRAGASAVLQRPLGLQLLCQGLQQAGCQVIQAPA
jgi:DNA-binding response OmpR family regulator